MSSHAIVICRAMIISLGFIARVFAQSGGGYDLTGSTIDDGGGTSAGGGYEARGTIGQLDASASAAITGGNYSLTGGFWGVTLPAYTTFVEPDFDHDCDVDTGDVDAFKACAFRSGIPLTAGCEGKDFDHDDDVDMNDFGILQRCYSGNQPANPNCAN